jgi:hypothetical protein
MDNRPGNTVGTHIGFVPIADYAGPEYMQDLPLLNSPSEILVNTSQAREKELRRTIRVKNVKYRIGRIPRLITENPEFPVAVSPLRDLSLEIHVGQIHAIVKT